MNLPAATSFDFAPRTRIVFGAGCLNRIGELCREYGGRRVLVVTDAGIVRAGHVDRAEVHLRAAGLSVVRFDRVVENPTTAVVDACVAVAREARIDLLVGLGGGSSMDTAKGCNFLLSCGGRMEDYWGVGKATGAMLPLVAVPTTAGTGSECQSFALIAQEETHAKMACGDARAAAKVAILDPVLTLTQPPAVAANTGIDALAHAVESAVSTRRTALSQMFSHQAFRLSWAGLNRVLACPDDLEARGQALLGAALAGVAIENSMLGAAHAAANPLTARFGVAHGQAVGLMLPAVVRLNGQNPSARQTYGRLAADAGANVQRDGRHAADVLAGLLQGYLESAGLARSLDKLQVPQTEHQRLAEEASRQWTAQFNPRPVDGEDFLRLYRCVAQNGHQWTGGEERGPALSNQTNSGRG